MLFMNRGVDVSLATLCRTLQRINFSHKQVSKAALERNEALRSVWIAEFGDIPADNFIWLDEASVDNNTCVRQAGWAPLERACVRRATFLCGQRYSILPALTSDGIIALDIFEGSVTKERFLSFLEEQLVSSCTF